MYFSLAARSTTTSIVSTTMSIPKSASSSIATPFTMDTILRKCMYNF